MSQLRFGAHTLDMAYRQAIPPFYTAAMVILTFLGKNKDHPGQEEWMEMQADLSTTDSDSGSDSEWKQDDDCSGSDGSSYYSCASDDALSAESSDVPDPESSEMSESEYSDTDESECSDANA
jgi:hypothetical protein